MSIPLTALLSLLSIVSALCVYGQAIVPNESDALTGGVQLFTTPDESSLALDSISDTDTATPLAEIQQPGGSRWFLVRTKTGTVGWIKQGSAKPLKEFDDFFKTLPPEPPSFRSTDIPNVRSGRAAHGAINVPIHISGRSVIVPVVFNSSVKTHLLLDTGASSTLISRNVATSLALHHIGAVRGVTVGGVINLAVARVKSLKIGSAEVFDLTVTIHDFSQHFPYDGLLGMDFLSQFDVSLHHHKRVLTLTPR